jgi:signal transduction histidine kinase
VQRRELDAAEAYLNRLIESAQRAVKEMRLLVYELRPLGLESGGLLPTLEKRLDAVERRAGVRAQLLADPLLAVPQSVERDLYHIVQEALNNSLKYAGATSVTVSLQVEGNRLSTQVSDDGVGFDVAEARRRGGMGLTSMQERADRLQGRLEVLSAPGSGATVRISLAFPALAPSGA